MTLLEEFRATVRTDAAQAITTYRAVLARRHTPRPGDGEALRDAAIAIGVTAADVERDVRALDEAERLEAAILSPAAATARRADFESVVADETTNLRRIITDALNSLTDEQFQGAAQRIREALFGALYAPDGEAVKKLEEKFAGVTGRWFEANERYRAAIIASDQARAQLAALRHEHKEAFAPLEDMTD